MEQNPDGSAVNPQAFIAAMRANPQLLASITASVPPLAQAVNTDDIAGMQEILRRLATHQKEMQERKAELARLQFADPMDMEAQRRIHELIEQVSVEYAVRCVLASNLEPGATEAQRDTVGETDQTGWLRGVVLAGLG
jgi:hypothetical protein